MLDFKNKKLLLNWKQHKAEVYILFAEAKKFSSYIKSIKNNKNINKERNIILTDYDLSVITGEKSYYNLLIQEIISDGRPYDLQEILYDLFGKDSFEYHQFIRKFIPTLEANSYQTYSINIAEHALRILNNRKEQPKEMRKALRNIKGLKSVLNVLLLQILTFPPKSKQIDSDEEGVVLNLSLSRIYQRLDKRLQNQWKDTKNYPQISNIIDILVALGIIKKLNLTDLNEPTEAYVIEEYKKAFYTMPNWYLCFNRFENAEWKKVNDLNLNSEEGIIYASAEEEFSENTAQNMLIVSGKKDRKIISPYELKEVIQAVKDQGYLTVKDAAKLDHFGKIEEEKLKEINFKERKIRQAIKTGYFERHGIKYVGIKELKSLGYKTDLKGRTKVLVEMKKAKNLALAEV